MGGRRVLRGSLHHHNRIRILQGGRGGLDGVAGASKGQVWTHHCATRPLLPSQGGCVGGRGAGGGGGAGGRSIMGDSVTANTKIPW